MGAIVLELLSSFSPRIGLPEFWPVSDANTI